MDKLISDLRSAADSLRTVAQGLHTPLDTSTFDRALDAVAEAAKSKPAINKAFPLPDK